MQQVLDDWTAAFNMENAGKVAMHYKSDATLFPPDNDVLQGRQNVAKPDEEIKIREPVASKTRHLSVPQAESYVMSDASSPRSSQQSEGNLAPGHSWLEIIKRPTPEAFAAAFTKDVVLDASVLPRSITGATDVRAFFGATRGMFDAIAFKHEVTVGSRTYLEWAFQVSRRKCLRDRARARRRGTHRLRRHAVTVTRVNAHRAVLDCKSNDQSNKLTGTTPRWSRPFLRHRLTGVTVTRQRDKAVRLAHAAHSSAVQIVM